MKRYRRAMKEEGGRRKESIKKIIAIYWGLGEETCPKILPLKIMHERNFRTVKKAGVQMSEAKRE
jgi:hypothetical protein